MAGAVTVHPLYERVRTVLSEVPDDIKDAFGRESFDREETYVFPDPKGSRRGDRRRNYNVVHSIGLTYPKKEGEPFLHIHDKISVRGLDGSEVYEVRTMLNSGNGVQFRTYGSFPHAPTNLKAFPKRVRDLVSLASDLKGKEKCRVLMLHDGTGIGEPIDHHDFDKY